VRRSAIVVLVVGALLLSTVTPAFGDWGAPGRGPGQARATEVGQAATPTASLSANDVTVSWDATILAGGTAAEGYTLRRFDATNPSDPGVEPGSACAGVVTTTSCTETGVPAGSWYYRVTPRHAEWTGIQSNNSNTVTVETAGSLVVTLTTPENGAFIVDKAEVFADVADPQGAGINRVELWVNGLWYANLSQTAVAGTYSVVWDPSSSGTYTLRVVGVQVDGALSYSATHTVSVYDSAAADEINPPMSIVEMTNLSGTVAAISNDPGADNGQWLVTGGGQSPRQATSVRVAFNTSYPNLADTQVFRALVRRTNSGGSHPTTARMELWENGAYVATIWEGSLLSTTGQVIAATWQTSLLTDPTGAGVEMRVRGLPNMDLPTGHRSTVEVGAVSWDVFLSE
jgi:hypothetical protein